MFESAQKRCETCMFVLLNQVWEVRTRRQRRQDPYGSLKMFTEPKIHGLIISFPTQTAISAYAVSPGFKGGQQKDVVFLFTRPRLWALQLPSVQTSGAGSYQIQRIIDVPDCSKSIGFRELCRKP